MRKLLLSLIGISIFGLLNAQNVVFHENFELPSGADSVATYSSDTSSIQNTWGISTDLYASGMRADSAICSPHDTLTLTTNSFSTVGNAFVLLDFDHICKIEVFDKAIIEVSIDGGITWAKLDTTHYMGGSTKFGNNGNVFNVLSYSSAWKSGMPLAVPDNSWWKHETFNMSAIAANSANVTVRFSLIDGNGVATSSNNYGWFLDNIVISASPSELVPPVITMVPPMVTDTIYSSSPQNVTAVITDNSGIDTAFVVYYVNGILTDTLGMTNYSADTFTVDIPFHGFGRTITYFVEAHDGAAVSNIETNGNYSYYVKYSSLSEVTIGSCATNTNYSPIYISTTTSSYTNSIHSSIYEASEFNNAGGIIESISFNKDNLAGYTSGDAELQIFVKESPTGIVPSTNTAWVSEASTATLVYSSTTQNINTTTGWQDFQFNTPFNYSGTNALLVMVKWYRPGSPTANYPSWCSEDVSTDKAKTFSGPTYPPTTSSHGDRPMAKFGFQLQPVYNDVGVADILYPTGGVVVNTPFNIDVAVKNFGADTINTFNVEWQLDGVDQTTYNYTSPSLYPDSLTDTITLANTSVTAGPHSIKVWTDSPDGSTDFNTGNDTTHLSFYGCANLLSGNYTIGGASADFLNFSEAVLGLSQCGINGPVSFDVNAGTYSEQLYLPAINGASATNTITFQSASGDSTDVILKYDANSASDNYVVELDGISNITFKGITFQAEDSSNAIVVNMRNHTSDIEFMNNRFVGMDLMDAAAERSLVFTEDTLGSNITFTNNRFVNGSNALVLSGSGMANVDVSNNVFNNQYASAVQISGSDATVVKHNTVSTFSTYDSYDAFFVNDASGAFEISYNNITAENTAIGYGIFINESAGDSLNHALVYNNMALINGNANTNNLSAGIINLESRFVDYYYNTVKMTGNDQNTVGMAIYDNTAGYSRGVVVKNNIFANMASGYAVYTLNIDSANITNDYNNLYTDGNGDYINLNGAIINNLTEWQVATGEAANSVSIDPYFAASSDLHVTNNMLNKSATPIAGITDDIDGDVRNTTNPDMGADEFDASPYDLAVLEVYGPQNNCGLSSSENITLKIKNIGTSNINSFDASYMLLNDSSLVTETVNTTINAGDTLEYTFSATVDMDMSPFMVDTTFEFEAWVDFSSDPVPQNDSAATSVLSMYQAPAPTASIYSTNYGDSVTITATSNDTLVWYETDSSSNNIAVGKYYTTPQLYDTTTYWVSAVASTGKQPIITEICHYKTTTGAPSGGWPAYLVADDYIEITGNPGADLEGITLEQWNETSLLNTHTFPQGTFLGPDGTAIIAVGQATSSTPSPSDYYYHGNISTTFSSSTAIGRILKDENGEILDAVGYSGTNDYVFPSASGVTSADWSGIAPSGSSTSGNRLEGPYTKDATNWINSDGNPQDPNTKNAGLVLPNALSDCESARVPVTVNISGIPTEDAGIVAMVSPASTVQEGNPEYIDVEVKNYVTNPLTSLDISWELDGQFQKTYSWSGSLSYQQVDTIRIDTTTFTGGAHDVRFWTSLPNGVADTINSNDTLITSFGACLHGTYTIGDTTQGNYDFNSFTDAVNALNGGGVCGHVIFEADSGVYNEQLHLTPITGVDSANTVTFTSVSGDSADVILQYNANSTDNYTILIDAASYITFNSITIEALNSSYGRVIHFDNESHHITISNNVIRNSATNSSSTYNAIFWSDDSNDDYLLIENNYIKNGSSAFYLEGDASNDQAIGNVIRRNIIEDFHQYGIYLRYQDSLVVEDNELTTTTSYSYATYGIYLYYSDRSKVLRNKIVAAPDDQMYGIRIYYSDGTTSEPTLVANNMVSITSGTDDNYGLHLFNSENLHVYYNTVNITGGDNDTRAVFIDNASFDPGFRFINNNIRDSISYALEFDDYDGIDQMDYNNYYTNAGSLVNWDGTDLNTLSDYQVTSGFDANSFNIETSFVSPTNLYLVDKTLAGKGTALSAVTTDIDGKQRGSMITTIGAHEVDLLPIDIGITNIINLPAAITEFDSITPHAVVINTGTDTITDYAIDYTVAGGTPVTKQITGNTILPYGQTDTIPLETFVSPAGNYQLCATTVLSTDSNLINDEACKGLFATPIIDGKVTHVDGLASGCNLIEDTIRITIKNVGLDTIDPGFDAKYLVDGITLVTETVTSQILPNDSTTFEFAAPVDLSVTTFDSIFNIAAWVEIPNDNVAYNDTNYVETKSMHTPITPIVDDVTIGIGSPVTLIGDATASIHWYYQDTSANAFYIGDTLQTDVLYADTTFYFEAKNGMGALRITEVTQYHGGGSGATSPEPSWLDGDDFVEITNVGASSISLDGYTHHREGSGDFSYDLPDVTLNAGEVMVLATYGASSDDPANNFYVAADNSVSSSTATGHWLTNNAGQIVDAVALNSHSFSAASGVSSSDWSGNIPSSGSNAGVVRVNMGSNMASNWDISSQTQQTLGTINPSIAGMQIGQACNSPRDSVNVNVVTPDFNAGVTDISVPSGCNLGMEPVTIEIVNLGQDTIDGGLTATFKVDNNAYISPENVTNVIAPFDTVSYTFNTLADLSGSFNGDTSYVVESYVSLTNDTLNYNDTIMTDTIKSLYTPTAPIANDVTGVYGDSITLTAISNDTLFWYENDSIQSYVGVGKYFTTPVLYDTTTYWVSAGGGGTPLVISELDLGTDDFIEVQNLTSSDFDATGWKVIVSDNYTALDDVNSLTWNLGVVPANSVVWRDDQSSSGSNYWGNNIMWNNGDNGWAMIVNDQGDIVEFVAWGWSFNELQNMNVSAGGFAGLNPINQQTQQWFGDGVDASCSDIIYRDFADNHDNTDFICTTNSSMKSPNSLAIISSLCSSPRVPLTVNIEVPDANAAITDIAVNSGCNLKVNEPVTIEILNMGALPINGNFTAAYRINGGNYITPENVNTVIPASDTGYYTFNATTNMLAPLNDTSFVIEAYITLLGDTFPANDTLMTDTVDSYFTPPVPVVNDTTINFGSYAILNYTTPYQVNWYASATAANTLDTGNIYQTPLLYDTTVYWVSQRDGAPQLQITEVTQYHGYGDGATSPEPSWLDGDDFVEITNLGTAPIDLTGYTISRESQYASGNYTYSLPGITLAAGEVMVLATYGASNDDPANNFYVAANHSSSSGDETGTWITDNKGDVVDAVALNGHQFSSASGITTSDWSGDIPSSSGDAGVIRVVSDNNNASDWIISSSTDVQTLGDVNPAFANMSYSGLGCESDRVPVTVFVTGAPPVDGQLKAIVEPSTGFLLTDNEPVTFRVLNNGTDTFNTVNLSYELAGQVPVNEIVSQMLAPGDTLMHTFNTTLDLQKFGGYTIIGRISVPGDTVNLNDTLVKSIKNRKDYCISKATSTSYNYIENVTVNNLNNTSTLSSAQYTDFTANVPAVILYKDVNHSMSISTASSNTYATEMSAKVFVDVNRDGVFDEATETFFAENVTSTSPPHTFVNNIKLPDSAHTGLTVMRVVVVRNESLADVHPCGTYTYGETEDYLVQVTPLIPEDAGVVDILKPGKFMFNSNQQFEVVVKNFGSSTLNTVDINYSLAGIPGTYTYNGNIPSQSVDTVVMPIISVPLGNSSLCAYTVLNGDSNIFNDSYCKDIHRAVTVTPPYYDGFEVKDYFMKDTTSNKVTQWEMGYPFGNNIIGPHSGNNAWMIDLDSNYANSSTDVLYSTRFAVSTQGVDSLVFWHYMDVESGADGGYVQYQNVTGHWTTLGEVNDTTATNWYTDTIIGQPAFSGNTNGWIRSAICIDTAHVPNLASITQFRFVFASDGSGNSGDGWAIDDFEIKIPKVAIDAGVKSILNPIGSTITGDPVTVEVQLKNHGSTALNSMPVTYKVGNSSPVTETWTGNLLPDAMVNFSFTTTFNGPANDYKITAYTELVNDGNHFNDTSSRQIVSTVPALDAGVVDIRSITNPSSGPDTTWFQKDVHVVVTIKNFGSSTLTTMDVEYQRGSLAPVTETWTGSLLPHSTVEYTFTTTYVSGIGNYAICSRTLLTNDADPANNETCEGWTGVIYDGIESNELAGFILHQNIPNPAKSNTSIDFEVPYGGKAVFELVDVFGRTLRSEELDVTAGRHVVHENLDDLAAGVYYYHVTFDGHRLVKKMTIVK